MLKALELIAPLTLFLSDTAFEAALSLTGLLAQGNPPVDPDPGLIQRILANPLILPVGLFVIFYLTFIAPERRRKAEEAKMMSALKKNDRVVTIGGIHGTVVSVSPDSNVVTLRIDENGNTRIKVNRSAVATITSAAGTGSTNKQNKKPVDNKSAGTEPEPDATASAER